MKKSCLFFDKKYKCVWFKVHYTGLTLKIALETYNPQIVTQILGGFRYGFGPAFFLFVIDVGPNIIYY